ncbi:phage major capsid protein, HK97 family [Streptoalloteichus tenebrarius]|uniref:Phage major capsid protein, HK97 family n=1 Tax=Streptoalloteichus tenebrarius (strain ATCC 17920 / DSM 40477 / JCM 4838 / CBS 697.72 / NBRC 16177 / NCIMB 11028 / NRRL B-12390 / A12253. 1 / ISP 5477) TaxID=1933 RepID=A0ABT1HV89_STRSD|nr:phage major capsid protein [Streptoalloteichus tenebrarius]MCP2259436.1 phage major capsid protein, HK97 family [Streptoalloteichus tenebrarius]
MPFYESSPNATAILPDERGNAVFYGPLQETAVAFQVSTVVHTDAQTYRVPLVVDTPQAGWFTEGAPITETEPKLAETVVRPPKLAALTGVSLEMVNDSRPPALLMVGKGMVIDAAKKIDAAFFGSLPAPAPAGLEALTGVTTVSAPAAFSNLDPLAEALSRIEDHGLTTGISFVANPADALELAKLKQTKDSNAPLLGIDPSNPTRRVIFGYPLFTSPAVTKGHVWAIPRERVTVVQRTPAELEASRHAAFNTYEALLRLVHRVGFAFTQPSAVVKIVRATA